MDEENVKVSLSDIFDIKDKLSKVCDSVEKLELSNKGDIDKVSELTKKIENLELLILNKER